MVHISDFHADTRDAADDANLPIKAVRITMPAPVAVATQPGGAGRGWAGSPPSAISSNPDGSVTLSPISSSSATSTTAVYKAAAAVSVGAMLGKPAFPGASESQSSIGLSQDEAQGGRESWDYYASCDSSGLYVHKKTSPTKPEQICPCSVGDTIALSVDSATNRVAVFRNSIAEGWMDGPVPTTLYPHGEILAGGYVLKSLTPVSGPTPPPTPPPPPPPPVVDVMVNKVTVELFGANARFGGYTTHGSATPGAGSFGGGAANSGSQMLLLDAVTDQAHGTQCTWEDDFGNSIDTIPGCASCRDEGAVEPYLKCSYTQGPGAHVSYSRNESFLSFRTMLLAHDSDQIQRQVLGRARATQLLAPQTTENPIFFHLADANNLEFTAAIDQMVEVGFDMLIFSFGSGFTLESADPMYLAKIKKQVDYAKTKGIEVGGYDLICLDRGGVNPAWQAGGDEGNLCFASGWYDHLNTLVANFINATGLSMLETDGPYGGDTCSSTNHPHHHGLEDSIYRQTQLQGKFYADLRQQNVFINQPDNYFFQGGSKSGMGYDEQQYSLPRWRDLSVSRMGMYDDLYHFLPTQGWMFLPITDYHAGGADATFGAYPEAYEWGLAQYLGAGVAACYRGDKPYASPEVKAILIKWISFYKAHRLTMIQPIVHIRRPTMQSWDGWLHVNPFGYGQNNSTSCGKPDRPTVRGRAVEVLSMPGCSSSSGVEVGVAMIFNPTDVTLPNEIVSIPLYYTGLETSAQVSVDGGAAQAYPLARDYSIQVTMSMAPRSIHTIVITSSELVQ